MMSKESAYYCASVGIYGAAFVLLLLLLYRIAT